MTEWMDQQHANILALLTASQYAERKKVLENLCMAFAKTKITWALSMSASLFMYGVWDDFNDFDILIELQSVEEFERIFTSIGGVIDHNTKQKEAFCSPYYKEATIGTIHFDLIGDIALETYNTHYCYRLKQTDVEYLFLEKNIPVPLCPMEANLLLYAMMEGWQSRRKLKRRMCVRYLHDFLIHPDILETALKGEVTQSDGNEHILKKLPKWLEEKVNTILRAHSNWICKGKIWEYSSHFFLLNNIDIFYIWRFYGLFNKFFR